MNNERKQCIYLALDLGYEGDIESDFHLMNFLLLLCLKRTLTTRWNNYLHVWQRLRQWESGTMTYGDLYCDLAEIALTDARYKEQQEERIQGLFKASQR